MEKLVIIDLKSFIIIRINIYILISKKQDDLNLTVASEGRLSWWMGIH